VLTALLLGITLEPPKRHASEADWPDGVVSVYAQHSGISLAFPLAGTGGASGLGGGGDGAVISSEEFHNLSLTSSRLAISTLPGIGFAKTLRLCAMISLLVGLPSSIEKSPRVALLSLIGL
jgi:hypothetical protein